MENAQREVANFSGSSTATLAKVLKSVANLSWLKAPKKKMLVVDQIVRVKRDQKMSQNG